MGDHTDQTGGFVLPAAIDLGTTVVGERTGDAVVLRSSWDGAEVVVPLDVDQGARLEPRWARYVAAVVHEVRPATGFIGTVTSTLPIGAGLSSSASFELAVALALGVDGTALDLARLGQRAEHAATGVPCGIMDQLASAAGVAGHALLIDCERATVRPTPVPEDLEIVVVHSGVERTLEATPYASLVASLHAAQAVVGPLRDAHLDALTLLDDVHARQARHVITENARVHAMADALAAGDRAGIGALLRDSHASLRGDLGVSLPVLDELVERLEATPGVLGARLTGAGFGGCVVVLAERGAVLPDGLAAWRVTPSAGASVTSAGAAPPSSPGTRPR
jgi:galactokinase